MNSCSEYVSLGHSDKTADAIASHLLDEYIKHDPKTRFAIEVQLKDHTCNLAGEVTSTWKPTDKEIADLVRDAIRKVGYTAEYAAAQHEHGEWKHAPGRGAKYLENACGDTRVHEKMTAEAAKEMRL